MKTIVQVYLELIVTAAQRNMSNLANSGQKMPNVYVYGQESKKRAEETKSDADVAG